MKRNIYFPEWMDAKMAEHPDQNWSAICQEAVAKRLVLLDMPEYRELTLQLGEAKLEVEHLEAELDALIEKHQ
jgi:hypothetical protein